MPLPSSFFEPFDTTYSRVTERMRAYGATLPAAEQRWLTSLIDGFMIQRNRWTTAPEIAPYLDSCARLRWRFLRLIASAYLHVSYDLPRVIANHWNFDPPRVTEERTELIFFDLSNVFPEILETVAVNYTVSGWPSIVAKWFVPKGAVKAAAHWVLLLRASAWIHARRLYLSKPQQRHYREKKMLEAITAAVADVSNLRPWSAGLLFPPNLARAVAWPSLPDVLVHLDRAWVGSAAAASLLMGAAIWRGRHQAEMQRFVDELGRRVYDYVNAAIFDPEGLSNYLRKRAPGHIDTPRGTRAD
jgi:hypothetical protein